MGNKYRSQESIQNSSIEELNEKLELLKLDSKSNEETGAFLTKLSLGPFVAGLVFAFLHLIPGLIISGILGTFLVTGCVFTAKSVKCDELIKKINEELQKRPTQLAMEEILNNTYKPTPVKKGKTKNATKEQKDELGL